MYESVEDGIGCSGIGVKTVIPVRDGYLRCDDGGFYTMPVLNDFHQVEYLLIVEFLDTEVIDDNEICGSDFLEEGHQPLLRSCHCDFLHKFEYTPVSSLIAADACVMTEGRSKPALARAGGSGNDDGQPTPYVITTAHLGEEGFVDAPCGVTGELLYGDIVAEVRLMQQARITVGATHVGLALKQKPHTVDDVER